jgi:hypothetical protein
MDRTKGATLAQWQHFGITLKLREALLPVVADPDAEIPANSRLQQGSLGKVPSKYNSEGMAVGLAAWVTRRTTDRDFRIYSQHGGYSIGVNAGSGGLRALDVDVTDPVLAARIDAAISDHLMMLLPKRTRPNSSKFLMPFRLVGDFPKRHVKVGERQQIEFLGDGQQWVAAGTHPSGVRYEWSPAIGKIPELAPELFEELWAALVEEFGTEPSVTDKAPVSKKEMMLRAQRQDPVAQYLQDNDWVIGAGRDDSLAITCPFAAGHTPGPAGTSTVYFVAHTGGHPNGHFKCLHASCGHRTDSDFLDEIGYTASQFTEITPNDVDAVTEREAFVALKLPKNKAGRIMVSLKSLAAALDRPGMTGIEMWFDPMRSTEMIMRPDEKGPRPMVDADPVWVCRVLEDVPYRFAPISSDMMSRALKVHMQANRRDSGHEWIKALPAWDGVSRVAGFAHAYLKAEASDYATAVSRYLWTAMAARLMAPPTGVKIDMVVVLVGGQGVGKSTAVRMMAPHPDQFVELDLARPEDDRARQIQGKSLIELGELTGLGKREKAEMKAWITKTHDRWVPKYVERAIEAARRCVFIGTTNEPQFLTDDSGERRWLPLTVGAGLDTAGIERDRVQLWAEAVQLFLEEGVVYREAEVLAPEIHGEHKVVDVWEEIFEEWLSGEAGLDGKTERVKVTTARAVLMGALGWANGDIKNGDLTKAGTTLKKVGYVPEVGQRRVEGQKVRQWWWKGALGDDLV